MSRQIVIGDEDPRQFEELRRGLEGDFKLGTTIETELVELLAGQLWRLRPGTSVTSCSDAGQA